MIARTSRISVVVLMTLAALHLGALDADFGGTLDNRTSPAIGQLTGTPQFTIDQWDRLSLWGAIHFGKTLTITGAGSYTFTLAMPYLFNPDTLKIDLLLLPVPSVSLEMGRFAFSDPTGHVLLHTLDGAQLEVRLPFAVFNAGAGYSGFLLKPVSTIVMSLTDDAGLSDDSVFFGAPRLIETFTATFPQLLLRQDLTLSVFLQQDLRPDGSFIPEGEEQQSVSGLFGGRLDSEYFGVGLSGPIAGPLYYNGFFYFNYGRTLSYVADAGSGTGYSWQYRPITAFFGGFDLRCYLETFLSTRIELSGSFASGDPDNTTFLEGNTEENSTLFASISPDMTGMVFSPQWANIVLIEGSYSMKPFSGGGVPWSNLQVMLKALAFLRPTLGAISLPVLDPVSTQVYLGTEADLIVNFRVTSELGLAVSVGGFLPNAAAFTGPSALPALAGRFDLSFSF